MNTRQTLGLSAVLLFSTVSPVRAQDLDLDVLCPPSVVAGANLTVTLADIENWDDEPVTLSRFMVGFLTNKGNTLGGVGIQGPFVKGLGTAKVVPARNPMNYAPGRIPNFTLNVGPAPQVSGKAAVVFLGFITSRGKEVSSDDCMVNILAP